MMVKHIFIRHVYDIYKPRFDCIMQRVRTKMFRESIFLVVSVYGVCIILKKKTELWKLITNTDTWQSGTLSVWEFLYIKFCFHNNTPTFTPKCYVLFLTDKKDIVCTLRILIMVYTRLFIFGKKSTLHGLIRSLHDYTF